MKSKFNVTVKEYIDVSRAHVIASSIHSAGKVDTKYSIAINDVQFAYDGSVVTVNEAAQLQVRFLADNYFER